MKPTILSWQNLKEVNSIRFEDIDGNEKDMKSAGVFTLVTDDTCEAIINIYGDINIDERFILCNFYSKNGRRIFALPLNYMQIPRQMKFSFTVFGREVREGNYIKYGVEL